MALSNTLIISILIINPSQPFSQLHDNKLKQQSEKKLYEKNTVVEGQKGKKTTLNVVLTNYNVEFVQRKKVNLFSIEVCLLPNESCRTCVSLLFL